mmetsp:Transcript_16916/g.25591  ORF Transcript_16916/g.25591 Transcript_16916/m.25591 type:complete len:89 (+) Transcript_16916:864-1130(+)
MSSLENCSFKTSRKSISRTKIMALLLHPNQGRQNWNSLLAIAIIIINVPFRNDTGIGCILFLAFHGSISLSSCSSTDHYAQRYLPSLN